MAIKKLTFLCSILLLFICSTSCFKAHICADAIDYTFDINAIVFPDKDSIYIGDTIWLEVNSPTLFTNKMTGQPVDFSIAANLGTSISIGQFLNKDSVGVNVDNLFNYVSVIGSWVPPTGNANRGCTLKEVNNTYQLKVGIVPKQKGLYLLILGSPSGIYRKYDVCSKASFTFTFKDTHQHMYLSPYYDSSIIIPSNPDYFFKVY